MSIDTEFEIMSLYPEQIRAIDFLRLKGTQAELPKLREQLVKAFVTLETLADDVPPAWRAVRPGCKPGSNEMIYQPRGTS